MEVDDVVVCLVNNNHSKVYLNVQIFGYGQSRIATFER